MANLATSDRCVFPRAPASPSLQVAVNQPSHLGSQGRGGRGVVVDGGLCQRPQKDLRRSIPSLVAWFPGLLNRVCPRLSPFFAFALSS